MWGSIVRAIFFLALTFGSTVAGPFLIESAGKADEVSYRLPNNSRPIIYDIHLTTNVDKGETQFTGRVIITLEMLEPSTDIVLHARQLKIGNMSLMLAHNSSVVYNIKHSYDNATEFLKISAVDQEIPIATYLLNIHYTGELRKDNAGFYLSTYKNKKGENVNIATTQFESTDARHAFPCYDEPAKKAVFYVSITHGKDYSALSNMPVLENVPNDGEGTVLTKFEPTKLMSTYLLAFIVSDFVNTENYNGIPHKIYSRSGTSNDQYFALKTSGETLKAIENYVGVKFSLPKMDNVAVPDFAAGAMENWGLVTYREEYLLFDDKKSTSATKTNIATIEAHEFGHQWFGNLVSPLWWTYLWLNEGFASLFAHIATDKVFPEWDIMQDFVVSDFQRALLADGKVSPRAMTHYVESPKEISGIFDSVVYSKAASVLQMFQHAFTDGTFKKALNDYLQKMEYQSAEEDDLFESFEKVLIADNVFGTTSASNIRKMFKSWTNQGGYPLVTVTRDYERGTFAINQEPFDGSDKTPTIDKRSWWVPYNFATASDAQYNITTMEGYLNIGESMKTITLDNRKLASSDWLVFNKRATSYYRVNYDAQNWKLLTQALIDDPLNFHAHNRAQLLDDAYRLAMAKRLQFETLFELSVYLKKEVEYAPWMTANSFLTSLNTYLNGDKEYDLLQFYIGKIIEDFYRKVGVTENASDAHLLKSSRSIAVNWACRANYGNCLEVTNNRLKELIQSKIEIEPNMRDSILCNGLMKAGETEYNFIIARLMNSEDQAERRQLMSSSIGCIQDVSLLRKYLLTSIQRTADVNYREQERLNVLSGVVNKGPVQLAAVIDFVIDNHVEYAKLPNDFTQNTPLQLAIQSIASRIVSKEQEEHFEKLLNVLKGIQGIKDSDLIAVRATVKKNLDWIIENRSKLIDWLTKFKYGNGSGDGGDGASTVIASTSAFVAVIVITLRALI